MTVSLTHAYVVVHDQQAALEFYRDLLGLEVRADQDFGGHRWLTVGAPGNATELVLETPAGRPASNDLAQVVQSGGLTAAILHVDDVDAAFSRLSAEDTHVLQPPTDQPYGVRDCAVRDPSGNMVRLTSPIAVDRQ